MPARNAEALSFRKIRRRINSENDWWYWLNSFMIGIIHQSFFKISSDYSYSTRTLCFFTISIFYCIFCILYLQLSINFASYSWLFSCPTSLTESFIPFSSSSACFLFWTYKIAMPLSYSNIFPFINSVFSF